MVNKRVRVIQFFFCVMLMASVSVVVSSDSGRSDLFNHQSPVPSSSRGFEEQQWIHPIKPEGRMSSGYQALPPERNVMRTDQDNRETVRQQPDRQSGISGPSSGGTSAPPVSGPGLQGPNSPSIPQSGGPVTTPPDPGVQSGYPPPEPKILNPSDQPDIRTPEPPVRIHPPDGCFPYDDRPCPKAYTSSHSSDYEAGRGSIRVNSTPSGVSVYLNNNYKGKTQSSGYLDIYRLIPGTYTVFLTCPGYDDYSSQIMVYRNEVTTIHAIMTLQSPVQTVSDEGILSIQSEPTGADLFLDNEYKGLTPLTLQAVRKGDHTILIRKEQYSEYTGGVYIIPNQTVAISVLLSPVSPPSLPAGSPPMVSLTSPVPVATRAGLSFWILWSSLIIGAMFFIKRNPVDKLADSRDSDPDCRLK
jgi:hypothetical protein